MQIMRINFAISIILVFGLAASDCFAQEMGELDLSPALRNYMIACNTMNNAVREKDKTLMESALEMLDNLNISLIPNESIHCDDSDNEIKPNIFYLPEYADKLLLDDFIITDLDEASLLRDTFIDQDVLVSHHGLKGKGLASYEIEGSGKMELLVTSNGNKAPSIQIIDNQNNKEYKDFQTSGNSSWIIWDMDQEGIFKLTITNNDDRDATFVIALN